MQNLWALGCAAVLGRAGLWTCCSGTIGGTYGSPVCCAAALATIKYMKDINLNQKLKK
jgi:4-aminobutyrate aminotransferase/(S)-3-amino-2-methylpropionate transaminase